MKHLFNALSNRSKASTHWLSLTLLTLALTVSQITLAPLYAANLGTNLVSNPSSGLGGTGFISEDPTSGFGGTGRASSGFGGTGVIGTITEFGSIWVNGIEIGYGDKTQVTSDLNENTPQSATAESVLKLGQQVILETLPNDEKALTKVIHLYYPLAGTITEVDESSVVINGKRTVLTSSATHYDDGLTLKIGQNVAVNGYQTKNGLWQATRISQNPQNRAFYQPTPSKTFSDAITKVVIETSLQQMNQWQALSNLKAKQLDASARIVVEGRWQNGQINRPQLQPYRAFVSDKMQNASAQLPEFEGRNLPNKMDSEIKSLKQEQIEMMQMQRDQKSMIQDQIDQVQQIQELKDQMDQMRGFGN